MTAEEDRTPRRELDHVFMARLASLEARMDNLQARVEEELREMDARDDGRWEEQRRVINNVTHNVQRLLDRQQAQQPALESITTLLHASIALRWIIITVVGTLAAIGTAATAIEALQRWTK